MSKVDEENFPIGQSDNHSIRKLTEEEKCKLKNQESRGLISDFKTCKFENESRKHWDIFYKRNQTNFFKDRHWTTREFQELIEFEEEGRKNLLEVGCGVGNFVFPLVASQTNLFVHCCDFSPRAVQFVKDNPNYDSLKINAFVHDITLPLPSELNDSIDIVSMVFVLSAIKPALFKTVFNNIHRVLKPGKGILLFRDYGLYDMAMLRFKAGTKIKDKYYLRQDGTTTYFFSQEEIKDEIVDENQFTILQNHYIHRRTVNVKEDVDVPRIFIQGKFVKK